jgi:hypothetical protein
MPTPSAAPGLLGGIGHGDHRGWCCLILMQARDLMRLTLGYAFLLSLNINLGLGDQYAVENLACLSRRTVGRV